MHRGHLKKSWYFTVLVTFWSLNLPLSLITAGRTESLGSCTDTDLGSTWLKFFVGLILLTLLTNIKLIYFQTDQTAKWPNKLHKCNCKIKYLFDYSLHILCTALSLLLVCLTVALRGLTHDTALLYSFLSPKPNKHDKPYGKQITLRL